MRERGGAALARDATDERAFRGQQQRGAIARALANEPTVILADEPTGNLDSATSADIMALLQDLNDAGRTIVMVTHDPRAASAADRQLHLEKGRLVNNGEVAAK